MWCLIGGGILLCAELVFIFVRIRNHSLDLEATGQWDVPWILICLIVVFPCGVFEIFPRGIAVHRETLQEAKIKTGVIESIRQLNAGNGFRYRPGSSRFFDPGLFKPGKMLTAESTMYHTDYHPVRTIYGRYYGAYLVIDEEKYLIISSTWFKEGDCVWIKYLPKSKIILEMDYAEQE
ncbi:MAG: hypothetical protein J5493_02535 [Lachnospiraceae bacterium]|nr:hypothetical protein [Lachnospiraceae bacterium]